MWLIAILYFSIGKPNQIFCHQLIWFKMKLFSFLLALKFILKWNVFPCFFTVFPSKIVEWSPKIVLKLGKHLSIKCWWIRFVCFTGISLTFCVSTVFEFYGWWTWIFNETYINEIFKDPHLSGVPDRELHTNRILLDSLSKNFVSWESERSKVKKTFFDTVNSRYSINTS